jgi:hypothetical protein
MAAARKAGGYPIPSSVSEEQQKRLDIGIHTKPHASGCEYYGTIDGQERGKFQS